ncbi:MAG: hypothetical protein LJE64_13370 [Desulfofustis sp.]|jgi:hypothetical protein|nr:hypothetical protein [Desulfofustis sp.]
MLKPPAFRRASAALAALSLAAFGCGQAQAYQCSGSMYNNPAFEQQVSDFSPYDKIYLIVNCISLEPGDYSMHVNWIHSKRGIVRSDKHRFSVAERQNHGVFFWMKLSKKGPLASMFSNQDFHEENFGQWVVEAYLNEAQVSANEFTITDD